MLAAMVKVMTAVASTMTVIVVAMTTTMTTTLVAAAAVVAYNIMSIIKFCALKQVTFFSLLHSANYLCGGGGTPKSSARIITHGVGMTPMHWVGASLLHRQCRGHSGWMPWLTPVCAK